MFQFILGGMARRPIRVSVSRKDRKHLHELLNGGVQPVRVVLRALALIHLGNGSTAPDTARSLMKLTVKAVRSIAHRYEAGGLDRALYEKPRPGAVPLQRLPVGDAGVRRHGAANRRPDQLPRRW